MAPIGKEGEVVKALPDEVKPLTVKKAVDYLRRVVEERVGKGNVSFRPQFPYFFYYFCFVDEEDPEERKIGTYLLVAWGEKDNLCWLDPDGYAFKGNPSEISLWSLPDKEGGIICLFRATGEEVNRLKLNGDGRICAPPDGGPTSFEVGGRIFTFQFMSANDPGAREVLRRYMVHP